MGRPLIQRQKGYSQEEIHVSQLIKLEAVKFEMGWLGHFLLQLLFQGKSVR